MSHAKFDVIIVGGGMVGSALACALSLGKLKVALIETCEPDTHWPMAGHDIRTSAITRASRNIFENIGAWQGMVERRACAYQQMRVWDSNGSGYIHFDCAEIAEPELGHIIENRIIQAALWERASQLDAITRFCPAQSLQITTTTNEISLHLADGSQLSASVLIGADGARSWVRDQAGIQTRGWPYQQHAIVTVVRSERHHQYTCWQRFASEGPLAFLPLDEHYSSIVWSTSPEQGERLLAMSDSDFLRELHLQFGDDLGAMLSCEARAAYPLRLSHATSYIAQRLALVGDAAHTIHPLAGQGVNLGLADAATLAEILLSARRRGADIGHPMLLRRYERNRKGANWEMQLAMDAFKRSFGSADPVIRLVRNAGLTLTDRLPLVKGMLVRRAMGITGELPTLARRPPGHG